MELCKSALVSCIYNKVESKLPFQCFGNPIILEVDRFNGIHTNIANNLKGK